MKFLMASVLFLLAACGDPAQQPQRLPTVPLAIEKQSGGAAVFVVQVADRPETTAKGLMWVKSMPESHGMLFKFPQASVQSFWMRNTLIPLDMIFIGASGRIMYIHENARPHDETGISSRFPVTEVLEVNAGIVAKWGIQVGDSVVVANQGETH